MNAFGYFFTDPEKKLARREFEIKTPGSDEAIVQVAGCGLCHTDLSFMSGQVKTKQELPLILGHEISGTVVEVGRNYQQLINRDVVIPAVLPCGDCQLCQSGRENICQQQKMPGNDFNGGFASHILVPARFLSPFSIEEITPNSALKLEDLSIVADAITTPYQSLIRSGLRDGELAIVNGVGGIGIYMVQHAKNRGAKVIAIDIDDKKLSAAQNQGADFTINASSMGERATKKAVRSLVKEHNLPDNAWKVFETSGTGKGQSTAFSLLTFAGTLGIVGFTMDKLNIRLSNVMAFDADIFGNWGCKPKYYNEVITQVVKGSLNIADNSQVYPLDSINEIIELAQNHKLEKRAILIP